MWINLVFKSIANKLAWQRKYEDFLTDLKPTPTLRPREPDQNKISDEALHRWIERGH